MDLTRNVVYRGYSLNSLVRDATTSDLWGCEITSVQYGQVLGVGYDEKRALDEGRDASDVYLDQRLISLAGNIYGRTKAEAMDEWVTLCEKMSPSAAYRADPSHRGYSPLRFFRQTKDARFSTGLVEQMLMARPMATPGARFDSDMHGGMLQNGDPADVDALAIPWTCQMAAKDPRIVNVEASVEFPTPNKNDNGTIRNRGTVPAVLEVYLLIPPGIMSTASPGSFRLTIGALELIFTLPRSSFTNLIRYSTDQKTLAYGKPNEAGSMRMDLLKVNKGQPHNHVPPGETDWDWHLTSADGKPLAPGSYFRIRDTWV